MNGWIIFELVVSALTIAFIVFIVVALEAKKPRCKACGSHIQDERHLEFLSETSAELLCRPCYFKVKNNKLVRGVF